jgi:hypothetical protein
VWWSGGTLRAVDVNESGVCSVFDYTHDLEDVEDV